MVVVFLFDSGQNDMMDEASPTCGDMIPRVTAEGTAQHNGVSDSYRT